MCTYCLLRIKLQYYYCRYAIIMMNDNSHGFQIMSFTHKLWEIYTYPPVVSDTYE